MDDLVLQTNESQLMAAFHSDDELPMPFERDIFLLGVDVAGTSHIPNIQKLYDSLDEGERVKFIREPQNPFDEYAIRIDTQNDDPIGYVAPDSNALDTSVKLGYIPRSTNKVFARLMDAGKSLYGVVRHKEMRGDYCKIVIKIYMED